MKKNSIKQMLGLMGVSVKPGEDASEKAAADPVRAAEAEAANPKMSAAERLGSALLAALGGVEGVSEDELVDTVLGEWNRPSRRRNEAEALGAAHMPTARELFEARVRSEDGSPFGETFPTPVPMATGSGRAEPVDYNEMSAEQFNRLKKLLKKANADGKRIRL